MVVWNGPADSWDVTAHVKAPGTLLMLLESRAVWEYTALLAAFPWLRRVPPGDGHPVIVFPGLGASDLSTVPLRAYLRDRGYRPCAWRQGRNLGPRTGVLQACRAMVRDAAQRHGGRVSLVGWSLGGVYARELAKELPADVRCVITLGTPFAGHPRSTNAWRLYRMLSGDHAHDEALMQRIGTAPPVPTTSIYSRTDGIVAWQCSLNEDLPHTENIEVQASHFGIGMNPASLFAIADRLLQDPADWKRFDASGPRRWFFRTGRHRARQLRRRR